MVNIFKTIFFVLIHQFNELFFQFFFAPNDDESQYGNYLIEKCNLDFWMINENGFQL
jgi:hypothetical protein